MPSEESSIIPGFDFVGESDTTVADTAQAEESIAVAQIVSNLLPPKTKKKGNRKPRAPAKPKVAKAPKTTGTNKDEGSEATIRRSSRIKTLETRRGGQRRREIVFSGSTENLNRSVPSAVDDESNSSNSTTASTSIGLTGLTSTPNIVNTNTSLGSPPRDTTTETIHILSPASLKLKSRWRSSCDAESLSQTPEDSSSRTSIDADISSLSLTETQVPERKTELEPNPNLMKKPGSILFDQTDTDLTEKLTKFQGIEENVFKSAQRKVSKESRGFQCDCYLSKEEIGNGEVGCNDNCLNRLLMVECGPQCQTEERCTNKRFQRREYCNLEIFKTEKKGHGLRTRQALARGGFVIEYVGEVLDPREFGRRAKEYAKENQEHFYFMAMKSDAIIDATQRGNCSRFINHSCEPNCETQKWTVNGELRIGFFAIKDLDPGEEITFDYQFQRYGKEAQKCFCLAASCRGWIGGEENEENENDGEEEEIETEDVETSIVKPKPKRRVAPRKQKKAEVLEDKSFEEELSHLARTGLRNKNHTLSLCRLMVRAENWDARERILNILIEGDTPCRRLFLDYHGLRLIWGWMSQLPLPTSDGENTSITTDHFHKLFIKSLHSLPIPNKSMLQDSKILSMIETWSLSPAHTAKVLGMAKVSETDLLQPTQMDLSVVSTDASVEKALEIPLQDAETPVSVADSESQKTCDIPVKVEVDVDAIAMHEAHEICSEADGYCSAMEVKKEETEVKADVKVEPIVQEYFWEFVEGAKELLSSWTGLQEVFRIPKKERVEQMKEHEREADKSDRLRTESEKDRVSSYDRDRPGSRYRRNERRVSVITDSNKPYRDYCRNSGNRFRNSNMFSAEAFPHLSKEERRNMFAAQMAKEEADRKMMDEMLSLHHERCLQLQLDFTTTPIVDPSCRYYLELPANVWKEIDVGDPLLHPGIHIILQSSMFPPFMCLPDALIGMETPGEELFPPWPPGLLPPPPLPPATLPKYWKMNVDDEGRCYYYDVRTSHSQWTPPSPDSTVDSEPEQAPEDANKDVLENQPLNANSDESNSKPSLSEETVDPQEEQDLYQKFHSFMTERAEKRKRSGLVTEWIFSPCNIEESNSEKPKEGESDRETSKEGEEDVEKPMEHECNVEPSKDVEGDSEQSKAPEDDTEKPKDCDKKLLGMEAKQIRKKDRTRVERKPKKPKAVNIENFRSEIANTIVQHLNPYRKPGCKSGHISNTEDFKHLARKITHAITLKEIKHSKDGKTIVVTDSVKHKTKEYVKKYMAKFHGNYARSPD